MSLNEIWLILASRVSGQTTLHIALAKGEDMFNLSLYTGRVGWDKTTAWILSSESLMPDMAGGRLTGAREITRGESFVRNKISNRFLLIFVCHD